VGLHWLIFIANIVKIDTISNFILFVENFFVSLCPNLLMNYNYKWCAILLVRMRIFPPRLRGVGAAEGARLKPTPAIRTGE
jgi:hypothetical protein